MKELALVLALAAALSACSREVDTASTASSSVTPSTSAPAPAADTSNAPSTAAPSSPSGTSGASTDTTVAANSTTAPPSTGTSATPDATATAAMGAAAGGQDTYGKACVVCHGAGVAGAPKLGDKADWGPRIAQGNDTLYEHAIKGYTGKKGMMPPKGGNTALPDADVKAAVDYMVAQAK